MRAQLVIAEVGKQYPKKAERLSQAFDRDLAKFKPRSGDHAAAISPRDSQFSMSLNKGFDSFYLKLSEIAAEKGDKTLPSIHPKAVIGTLLDFWASPDIPEDAILQRNLCQIDDISAFQIEKLEAMLVPEDISAAAEDTKTPM